MATVKDYATRLWQLYKTVALPMGVDLRSADIRTRVILKTTCVVFGVVFKILTDAALVTDAQLAGRLAAVEAELYEAENPEPTPAQP